MGCIVSSESPEKQVSRQIWLIGQVSSKKGIQGPELDCFPILGYFWGDFGWFWRPVTRAVTKTQPQICPKHRTIFGQPNAFFRGHLLPHGPCLKSPFQGLSEYTVQPHLLALINIRLLTKRVRTRGHLHRVGTFDGFPKGYIFRKL